MYLNNPIIDQIGGSLSRNTFAKFFVCLLFLSLPVTSWTQEADGNEPTEDKSTSPWTESAVTTFLFNQSAFNAKWQGGGVSNISGNVNLTYNLNYNKDGVNWDTKVTADYGAAKIQDRDNLQKTNDRLEVISVVGKKIKNSEWFYSGLFNFKTQFDSGFEATERTEIVNGVSVKISSDVRNSKFFSPAYFLAGPGILWKKDDDLKVNIAPSTAKLIVVSSQFTNPNDPRNRLDKSNKYFGVAAGETTRFELGMALNAYAKIELLPNVELENILGLYSNYLDKPKNVDIDYTANLNMRINNLITTNITLQAIYDDNAIQGFQIRQGLGIGVTYKLK